MINLRKLFSKTQYPVTQVNPSTARSRLGACVPSERRPLSLGRGAVAGLAAPPGPTPPGPLGVKEPLAGARTLSVYVPHFHRERAARAAGLSVSVAGRGVRAAPSVVRVSAPHPALDTGEDTGEDRPRSSEGPRRYNLKALAGQACVIRCSVSLL